MAHQLASVEISQLIDSPVRTQDGQLLGHISDFLVNPRSGKIEYIKLGVLIEDEPYRKQYISIPWSQFRLVNAELGIELNISPNVLRWCSHQLH